MIIAFLVAVIVLGAVVLFLLGKFGKKMRRPLNRQYYEEKWLELLARVKTPDGMVLAVIDADKLLDEALAKCGYKGKTMGERMVSAQRTFSNNDSAWSAHKLRNRLVHEPSTRLRQTEAKNALTGFRQALKDLGAL